MTLFAALLPRSAQICEMDLAGDIAANLFAPEETAIVGMAETRRRSFQAGRACAHAAMRQLGLPPAPVPMGADHAPVWPQGLIGSITHSRTKCAAALVLVSDGLRAIGIDLEEASALEDDLIEDICTPRERDWLSRQGAESGLFAKAIFSAKEAAYKCQYPLSRKLFGFDGMEISFNRQEGTFAARFLIEAAPFAPGDTLAGRYRFAHGHIATAIALACRAPLCAACPSPPARKGATGG